MKEKYEAVAGRLDALQAFPDIHIIAQIGADIDSLPLVEKKDTEWRYWRQAKLSLWLKAMDRIDRLKAPAFDPNDVPQVNVAPPSGTIISAGASPSAIKDPKLRKEYEQAIQANAEKAERYRLQKGIRKLDKDWTSKVRAYMKSQYTSNAQDVEDINNLIDKLLSCSPRREQMKNVLLGTK